MEWMYGVELVKRIQVGVPAESKEEAYEIVKGWLNDGQLLDVCFDCDDDIEISVLSDSIPTQFDEVF